MPMKSGLIATTLVALSAACSPPARGGLDDYLRKADPSFAWKFEGTAESAGAKVHRIALTSQTWQGIPWTHNVTVVEPADLAYRDAMVLFITGGAIGDGRRAGDIATARALAAACRARVAVLPQVPNQPLLDGKTEDTLIAETFVRYLDTKDEEWPLLFPMVKSAVKAMDALQAFYAERGSPASRFVVTGASKRGWTTWLTGATDPRVAAIAPMVIPTLNMKAQNKHQVEVFGTFSEQIDDYTRRGLTQENNTPEGLRLYQMIDPYAYRDRLALPKLQINGTNDPYWTLDSMNLFWDDLKGPKWVVYLPNAGHGLDQHRDYAIAAVAAIFRQAAGGKPLPKLSWRHSDAASGALRLEVSSEPAPRSALAWTASSETMDFRKSPWTSTPIEAGGRMSAEVPRPAKGNVALFADLEYEADGLVYHLSTQVRQTDVRPAPTR